MKSSLLIGIALLASTAIIAQNSPVDFETGGHGASWTWTVFENTTNPPLQIITNPDPTGANTSATVAEFTALQSGQPWAGCESMHGSDIGFFTLTPATSTIKIMVWKSVISDVGIKLVEANSGSLGEIKVANTVINQWEELTFDFTAAEGIEYDQIVIFPDFDLNGRTSDNICYFDNITFGNIAPQPAPMVAAPTPTKDDSLVISMFSDAYTDVTVDTWQTGWSVGTLSDIMIAGNATKQYNSVEFVGVETVGANSFDVTEMDTFHVDMWTPNATQFRVKLVDFGADNAFDGGDDTEHEVTYDNPLMEGWISYAIPMSDFVDMTSREHFSQLIFSTQPAGQGVLYIDNVYFSKEASIVPIDTTDTTVGIDAQAFTAKSVAVYPNPATDQLTVSLNHNGQVSWDLMTIQGASVRQGAFNTQMNQINLSEIPSGIYLLSLRTEGAEVHKRIVIQ